MPTLVHTSPAGTANQQIQLVTLANPTRSEVVPINPTLLDSTLVDNVSAVPGTSVTAALSSLSTSIASLVAAIAALPPILGPLVQQLNWNPGSLQTTTLVLLAAGHPPGLYELAWSVVVKTAATGTAFSADVSFTSTAGAETKQLVASITWGSLGSVLQSVGAQAGATREATVFSTGASPISITFQAGLIVLGSPVADLFGMTRRIAA